MKPLPEEHNASTERPTVWSATGLGTATHELIEHGVLYIAAPDNDEGYFKVARLDRHLRAAGLSFHRTRMSDVMKYELVGVKKGRLPE